MWILFILSGLEPEYCEVEECYIDNCSLKDVQWIACDVCSRWLHKYCCGLLEKQALRAFCDRHLQGILASYLLLLSLIRLLILYYMLIMHVCSCSV